VLIFIAGQLFRSWRRHRRPRRRQVRRRPDDRKSSVDDFGQNSLAAGHRHQGLRRVPEEHVAAGRILLPGSEIVGHDADVDVDDDVEDVVDDGLGVARPTRLLLKPSTFFRLTTDGNFRNRNRNEISEIFRESPFNLICKNTKDDFVENVEDP